MEGNGRLIDENNGTYDGMIGCVQRNETSCMMQFVRYDSTPFEPGTFVPFPAFADVPKIYTERPKRIDPTTADILILWTNFDTESWEYLLILFVLSFFIWIFMNRIMESECNASKFLWICFGLKVQQFNLSISKVSSCTILVSSISLSILYGYHYVLFNTLSSDLTVTTAPQSIDSLYDLLYDSRYGNVTPRISTMFNMYNTLSRSRNGTDEHVLFMRIMRNENESVTVVDTTNLGTNARVSLNTFESVSKGKSVFIENNMLMKFVLRDGSCYTNPIMTMNMMETKDIISPSAVAVLISKYTSEHFKKLFEYRTLTLSEFSLYDGLMKTHSGLMYESLLGPSKDQIKEMMCKETFDGTSSYEDLDIPWEPFKVAPFRRALNIYFTIIFISIIVLIIEKIYFISCKISLPGKSDNAQKATENGYVTRKTK